MRITLAQAFDGATVPGVQRWKSSHNLGRLFINHKDVHHVPRKGFKTITVSEELHRFLLKRARELSLSIP